MVLESGRLPESLAASGERANKRPIKTAPLVTVRADEKEGLKLTSRLCVCACDVEGPPSVSFEIRDHIQSRQSWRVF